MKKFIAFLTLTTLLLSACNNASVKTESAENSQVSDPLPSWNEGPAKTAIIEFVNSVIKEGGAQYVSPEERIATFDNDGTLWCEQPVPQLEFAAYQVKKMAVDHPEWNEKQPFKSVLEDDKEYLLNDLLNNHGKELMKLITVTHAGMILKEFNADVKAFLNASSHPKYGKKYTETIYQPMLELLHYLRDNNFKTYICSDGGNSFMRVFAEDVYGIVPENVIGTFAMNTFEQVDGKWQIVKEFKIYPYSEKDAPRPRGYITPDDKSWSQWQPRGTEYWERLHEIINREPFAERDRFYMAMLKSIGIEKYNTSAILREG